MVPQLRKDRNHIIAHIPALQQALAIQRPYVDQAVLENQSGPSSLFSMRMGASPTQSRTCRELSAQSAVRPGSIRSSETASPCRQLAHSQLRQPLQQKLQRDVECLHESKSPAGRSSRASNNLKNQRT
jgi:hypothetical protein